MIARYGMGGPSYPYPLRQLSGLGDEPTDASIAATGAASQQSNTNLANYAQSVLSVVQSAYPGASVTRIAGAPNQYNPVGTDLGYTIQVGSYTGPITVTHMQSISPTDWGNQLIFNANQANAITVTTPEAVPTTPAPISRVPIRTPMPTPVRAPSQLQIYQPPQQTDVNAATGQPAGVTPTTGAGPAQQIISVPPVQQAGLVASGVQAQYAPVDTSVGYASAGATGQIYHPSSTATSSTITDFLQGTMIDGIPNWLLIVGAIGAFALYRQQGRR